MEWMPFPISVSKLEVFADCTGGNDLPLFVAERIVAFPDSVGRLDQLPPIRSATNANADPRVGYGAAVLISNDPPDLARDPFGRYRSLLRRELGIGFLLWDRICRRDEERG